MKAYINPQTSFVYLLANPVMQVVSPETPSTPPPPPYAAPARESYSPRQQPAN